MVKPPSDEKQLIKQAKNGNREAFNELTRLHEKKITKLIARYLSNKEDASDLTQETFIKAFSAMKSFHEDSTFYSWLYRVAVNTAKNYLSYHQHHGKNHEKLPEDKDVLENSALVEFNSPEYLFLCKEAEDIFSHMLDDMPSEIRETLLLREVEDLSYADIARKMHCPLGTVRSRIFRGREMVMLKLKE